MNMHGEALITPEAAGVRSAAVCSFLEAAAAEHLEIHALLMRRNSRPFFECRWSPFTKDSFQRICSAGKTLTSIAAMFAVQEGRFGIHTPVRELFKEASVNPQTEEMTLFHLLTMHAGHTEDSYGPMFFSGGDPFENFFRLPFNTEPGTQFFYDNGIPDILAEAVRRSSGLRLSDYLQPRLFAPLGIKEVRVGDRGEQDDLPTFCMKTEDLMTITLFLYNKGAWNGKQLLKEDLVEQLCAWQVPTTNEAEAAACPEQPAQPGPGYGFQLWRNSFGGFALNGGAGQYGICVPELDLCIAMHSNEVRSSRIVELLWQHLRGNIFAQPLREDPENFARLCAMAQSADLCPSSGLDESLLPGGRYLIGGSLCGVTEFSIDPACGTVEFKGENGLHRLKLSDHADWAPCGIPFVFPEMHNPSEHRNAVRGVRLDSNVGCDFRTGYCKMRTTAEHALEIWFRSEAWMGSNIVCLDPLAQGGIAVSYEYGISYNLAHSSRDIGSLRESVYREVISAVPAE